MDLSQFRLATNKQSGTGPIYGATKSAPFLQAHIKIDRNEQSQSERESVIVSLSARASRNSKSPSLRGVDDSVSAPSAIQSILAEISSRTQSIKSLLRASDKLAPGSKQLAETEKEIAAHEQALQAVLESDNFGEIIDISNNVQQILAAGGNGQVLSRALQGNAALLGNNFLARIASGDSAGIERFTNALSSIKDAVSTGGRGQAFFDLIDTAVQNAVSSLEGPPGSLVSGRDATAGSQTLIAPVPQLSQLSFEAAGNLALGIQGYIGSNVIQAAFAHIEYDPRQALVLLADKSEDSEAKLREEERAQSEADNRLAAGLRSPTG